MAYFFRKKKKNKYYVYKGESAYERGTSVRKKSRYVGPYDELCEYFEQSEAVILHQQHFEYGLSRTIYELTKQIGLIPIFQNIIKSNGSTFALTKRILVMIINRLIWPCAKYSIEKWYSKSDLCNYFDLLASELASHKVYRAMDKLDDYSAQIESAICKVISAQENVSFATMYLDFTNQETYSRNHESQFLNYGHNKHGKDDLYQINISLCCDAESGIPFFHKSYAGNFNDKQFIQMYAKELRERLQSIGWKDRNMLVIDRGINGKDNFALLLEYGFDYIGGLIESEFPEYFNIPKSNLRKRHSRKRETKPTITIQYISKINNLYGKKHRVVVFFNKENYEDKVERLEGELSRYQYKCEQQLQEFKKEISEKTFQSRWNNKDKINKKLKEINKKLFPLFKFTLKSYRFELTWKISRNEKAYKQYIDKFGKHVLFTNKHKLKAKEILDLFFNKDKIEKNFQFLKANAYTNRFIVLGPMLHSKDNRIESHVYTCIIALQLYQIMRNRLKKKNIQLTTQQALEELEEITCYYTKIAGKKEAIRHINSITNTQRKILKALQINIFE